MRRSTARRAQILFQHPERGYNPEREETVPERVLPPAKTRQDWSTIVKVREEHQQFRSSRNGAKHTRRKSG